MKCVACTRRVEASDFAADVLCPLQVGSSQLCQDCALIFFLRQCPFLLAQPGMVISLHFGLMLFNFHIADL